MEGRVARSVTKDFEEGEQRVGRRGPALKGTPQPISDSSHRVLEGRERERGAALEVPVNAPFRSPVTCMIADTGVLR